jgi:hypothetical protein
VVIYRPLFTKYKHYHVPTVQQSPSAGHWPHLGLWPFQSVASAMDMGMDVNFNPFIPTTKLLRDWHKRSLTVPCSLKAEPIKAKADE